MEIPWTAIIDPNYHGGLPLSAYPYYYSLGTSPATLDQGSQPTLVDFAGKVSGTTKQAYSVKDVNSGTTGLALTCP